MENAKTSHPRILTGTVVSAKMKKTIVVRVDRMRWHPKYRKQYRISATYKVHDEKQSAKEGNVVEIAETRPISRDKRWRLLRIVK